MNKMERLLKELHVLVPTSTFSIRIFLLKGGFDYVLVERETISGDCIYNGCNQTVSELIRTMSDMKRERIYNAK